jgi:hypothetical protein
MDQENSKTQGGKGQMRKIQKKNKKERKNAGKKKNLYAGKKKKEILTYVEVPIVVCSPSVGNTLVRHSVYSRAGY